MPRFRRLVLLVSALSFAAAPDPAVAQGAQPDSAAASRRIETALALVDRAAAAPDSSTGAIEELQRALVVLGPGEMRVWAATRWVDWLARAELARRLALAAVHHPGEATLAPAVAALDSATAVFWNCDRACGARDRRAFAALDEARMRLESLRR